jgi:hypothetical protein
MEVGDGSGGLREGFAQRALIRVPRRRVGEIDDLRRQLLEDFIAYGSSGDDEVVPDLRERYAAFSGLSDPETRIELLRDVARAVGAGPLGIHALFPFIYTDPDPNIISTASLEAALLVLPVDDDLMTGPGLVLRMGAGVDGDTRAAMLGGLLLLGDGRVLSILRDSWRFVPPESRGILMSVWSGYALAPMVEFFLDWLEDAPEYDFGGIVHALARIPERAEHPEVLELERSFPVTESVEPFRTVGRWSFEEYGERIAPRLMEVRRRENAPRVTKFALRAWGIRI